MTTSLTLYLTNIHASTVSTAHVLATGTGGSLSNGASTTGTRYALGSTLRADGTASTYTAAGMPAQAALGFLLDAATLENQTIPAGDWTLTIDAAYAGAIVYGNWGIRLFKRSSAGVYTEIANGHATDTDALTTSYVAHSYTLTVGSETVFAAGDKLYVEIFWWNNARAASTTSQLLWRISSTSSGVTNAQLTTPGYNAYTPTVVVQAAASLPVRKTGATLEAGASMSVQGLGTTYTVQAAATMCVGYATGGGPTVYRQDTFDGRTVTPAHTPGWGTASDSNAWTIHDNADASATWGVGSNVATYTGASTSKGLSTLGAALAVADVEAQVKVRFSGAWGAGGCSLTLRHSGTASGNWYGIGFEGDSGLVVIKRYTSGSSTALVTRAATLTSNTDYWIKAKVSGTNLYFKYWADGSAEPDYTDAVYGLTTTDTTYQSAGYVGLRLYGAETWTVDAFEAHSTTAGGLVYHWNLAGGASVAVAVASGSQVTQAGASLSITGHAAGAYKVAFVSDTQPDGTSGVRTRNSSNSQLALDWNPDLMLFGGDMVMAGGSYASDFDVTWGRLGLSKMYAAWGNHDYDDIGISATEAYWGSHAGTVGAGAGNHYHSLVTPNGWLILFLDFHDETLGTFPSAQLTWLQNTLNANPGRPTIAIAHAPAFTGGSGHTPASCLTAANGVWALLQAAGADLFLSGHNHCTERWPLQDRTGAADSNGIRQLAGGPGGYSFYSVSISNQEAAWGTNPQAASTPATQQSHGEFGQWHLWLYADHYDLEWVGIDSYHTTSVSTATHNTAPTTYTAEAAASLSIVSGGTYVVQAAASLPVRKTGATLEAGASLSVTTGGETWVLTREDDFQRANQTGWGTSTNPDGVTNGAWLGDASSNGSIASNAGTNTSGNVTNWTGILDDGTAHLLGQEVHLIASVTATNNQFGALFACDTVTGGAGTNQYRVRFGGAGYFELRKLAAGVYSTPANALWTITTGALWHIRARITDDGTGKPRLQGRFWLDGNTEPATWSIDYTDSAALAANRSGVFMYSQAAGNVKVSRYEWRLLTSGSSHVVDAGASLAVKQTVLPATAGASVSVKQTVLPATAGASFAVKQSVLPAQAGAAVAVKRVSIPLAGGAAVAVKQTVLPAQAGAALAVKQTLPVTGGASLTVKRTGISLQAGASIAVAGGASAYDAAILAETSLLRYYPLSESTGTVAHDLKSAYNGTIAGGVTLGVASLLTGDATSTAMTFDGSTGAISLPTTGLPTGNAAWSLEAWMNFPTAPAYDPGVAVAFGNWGVTHACGTLDSFTSGKAGLSVFAQDVKTYDVLQNTGAHHIIVAYDGTTLRLFVDGVADNSALASIPLAITLSSAYIGAFNTSNYFAGTLQKVAFYNAALTEAQAQSHYNAGNLVKNSIAQASIALTPRWRLAALDFMKVTKDNCLNQFTTEQMTQAVSLASGHHLTHIAIATAYDYPAYLASWVAAIRAAGLKVWFRSHWNAWEGDYGAPPTMTPAQYLQGVLDFIAAHPTLFEPGDILDACPEAENGAYWEATYGGTGWMGNPTATAEYNTFCVDLHTDVQSALATAGVANVRTNVQSHSGYQLYTPTFYFDSTVQALDNCIALDGYADPGSTDPAVNAQALSDLVDSIRAVHPQATMYLGEVGYPGYAGGAGDTDQNQAAVIDAVIAEFASHDYTAGMNYWVGPSESGTDTTRLFNGTRGMYTERLALTTLANNYARVLTPAGATVTGLGALASASIAVLGHLGALAGASLAVKQLALPAQAGAALAIKQLAVGVQAGASISVTGTTRTSSAGASIAVARTATRLGGQRQASTTLPTASQYNQNLSGVNTTSTSTLIGTATGWGELYTQGNASAWPSLGSPGAPSGHGFLYDSTALEGQTIAAGNWLQATRGSLTLGTATVDLLVRWYIRHADGSYTAIGSASSSGLALTTAWTTYQTATVSLSAVSFATGDKLYTDLWFNVTTPPADPTTAWKMGDLGNDVNFGGWDERVEAPGFAPTLPTHTAEAAAALAIKQTLARAGGASVAVKQTALPASGAASLAARKLANAAQAAATVSISSSFHQDAAASLAVRKLAAVTQASATVAVLKQAILVSAAARMSVAQRNDGSATASIAVKRTLLVTQAASAIAVKQLRASEAAASLSVQREYGVQAGASLAVKRQALAVSGAASLPVRALANVAQAASSMSVYLWVNGQREAVASIAVKRPSIPANAAAQMSVAGRLTLTVTASLAIKASPAGTPMGRAGFAIAQPTFRAAAATLAIRQAGLAATAAASLSVKRQYSLSAGASISLVERHTVQAAASLSVKQLLGAQAHTSLAVRALANAAQASAELSITAFTYCMAEARIAVKQTRLPAQAGASISVRMGQSRVSVRMLGPRATVTLVAITPTGVRVTLNSQPSVIRTTLLGGADV